MAFNIIPRGEWDVTPNPDPNSVSYQPGPLIVHHSVYPRIDSPTLSEAKARIREIDRLHESKGWHIGVGYSFVIIGRYVFEGRWRDPGAHTVGFNSIYPAVCVDGNYTAQAPHSTELQMLVGLARHIGRDALTGHRDYNSTGCPGNRLYAELPRLTELIEKPEPEPFFFEEMPFTEGGIGPKLLGGWGRKDVRDSVMEGYTPPAGASASVANFDSEIAPYGIIVWPPGRYGMGNPRWKFDTKRERDAAAADHERKHRRTVRRFRGVENSLYARRP